MTPHRWIKSALKTVQAPVLIQRAIRRLIPLWKTDISIRKAEGGWEKIPISLERGLFQGDSLSQLLFGLGIAPLSSALRKEEGFVSKHQKAPVTHLLYMDNLKIYEADKETLTRTVCKVEEASRALGMSLGLPKCAVAYAKRGRRCGGGGVRLDEERVIAEAESGNAYRYLGLTQLLRTSRKRTKERVMKEYLKRIRKTWGNPHLSARAKVEAHNSECAGVFRYFFGAIRWTRSDTRRADRQTRLILSQYKSHHRGSAIERLYLPRDMDGRGLACLEHLWEREVVAVAKYLKDRTDDQIKGVLKMQEELHKENKYSFMGVAQEEASINREGLLEHDKPAEWLKKAQRKKKKQRIAGKKIHGVHYREVGKKDTDKKATNKWLTEGRLQAETEAIIVAAQDGVTYTRAYRRRVLKEKISPQCRACGGGEETLGHILSACPAHQWNLYKERHDRVVPASKSCAQQPGNARAQ